MLAVARALAVRGHDVVLASGPRHADDARRAGASFVPLPPTPGSSLHDLRPYEDAAAAAEAIAPLLRSIGPEAVVADLITLGAALAAEGCGIPWATLSIHALHTPSRDLPPFGWGRPPARWPLRWRDAWMRRNNIRDLERARASLNAARTRLGLPPTDRLEGGLSPGLVLVATLPSLEVPRSDWPPHAHVVGPCLWDDDGVAPALPPGDEPLVLVAASTAHDQGALVRASLVAVGALGARAVVTTGMAGLPARLPPRVVAAPFAPHGAILRQAAAVVCNGGHGIVARSLSHGVPVVVVPGPGDQRENGYRVERAGAGIRVLRRRDLALAPRIRRALARVLREPRFARAAAAIRAEAATLDGPAEAAELVEALAARYRVTSG